MIERKLITLDFPPYTEAEVVEIWPDGTIICDLSGNGYHDTGIMFKPDSPYYQELANSVSDIMTGTGK